jgi:hypothetical protein
MNKGFIYFILGLKKEKCNTGKENFFLESRLLERGG